MDQTYIARTDMENRWSLTSADHALVVAKSQDNRLSFAALLLFFRNHGHFPRTKTEIDHEVIENIALHLDVASPPEGAFNLSDRTWERHRAEIRALFGFREPTNADSQALTAWLRIQRVDSLHDHERLTQLLAARCQELAIEQPSMERIDRIVRSAVAAQDELFCAKIFDRLSPATRTRLEALLRPAVVDGHNPEHEEVSGTAPAILLQLASDPGRPSLASVQDELAKLELIRRLELPADLFDHALPQELERYRQRVAIEAPYELRRHPEAARLTWLAAFAHLRGRTLIDDLVELLIVTIHHIGARAERKVDRELLDDIKPVTGKQNLLFEVADATLEKPDGIVREVVFPVVSEETLRNLVKEWKATGPAYRTTLRTVIRNSYKSHYRRMVPQVLQVLNFRSNNERHRPAIQALDLVKRYAGTKGRTFPVEVQVPLDGVVRGLWREAVIEKDAQGRQRVNRITYEICVLEALREQLRCKEIWVTGANRYRNPDEDLAADFEAQRTPYYQALNLPLEPDRFIADLQAEMRDALQTLDAGLPSNPHVRISRKHGSSWITLTPFDAQPEPPNLTALKAEITATWPMTSLLDMVKEADLRLGFTRTNVQHPTYKAFAELGKASKTIFLCRYLHSEALRREINEGLNVIEQWNGANNFVFFARRGELASNRRENHEVSMLALHLLQNCMVYINTLMLQQVLAQPNWVDKLTPRDLRALTPLIWEHVNPYGRFELDMNARLPLE